MTKILGDRVELTDKQWECLRLVGQNFSSKQIARKLDISHHAVDQRIRFAVKALGAEDRFDAARIVATVDQGQSKTYEPLAYQPPHVEPFMFPDNRQVSGAKRDHAPDSSTNTLRDAGVAIWPNGPLADVRSNHLVSASRGFQAPLNTQMKLAVAIGIAVFSLIAFGAGISGLEVLSRLN
jgi:DNA-binding CsgD family transcriptional regulator